METRIQTNSRNLDEFILKGFKRVLYQNLIKITQAARLNANAQSLVLPLDDQLLRMISPIPVILIVQKQTRLYFQIIKHLFKQESQILFLDLNFSRQFLMQTKRRESCLGKWTSQANRVDSTSFMKWNCNGKVQLNFGNDVRCLHQREPDELSKHFEQLQGSPSTVPSWDLICLNVILHLQVFIQVLRMSRVY